MQRIAIFILYRCVSHITLMDYDSLDHRVAYFKVMFL